MKQHSAKVEINDMGSRMMISGVGNNSSMTAVIANNAIAAVFIIPGLTHEEKLKAYLINGARPLKLKVCIRIGRWGMGRCV